MEKGIGILEKYELTVTNVSKGRGMLLLDTNCGKKKLVEYTGSKEHVNLQNKLQEHLWEADRIYTDRILPNKDGEFFTTDYDGKKYVIKDHMEGIEADSRRETDLMVMAKNLANLHKLMLLPKELYQEDMAKQRDLRAEFKSHNQELTKIRSFMRKKSSSRSFERRFLKEFENFYQEGLAAFDSLEKSEYTRLSSQCMHLRSVCHGDYTYHNVINCGKYTATVNFEKCHMGIQVEDLYMFLRKVLEKNRWDISLGERLLSEYEKVRGLTKQERENLYIRLSFPEKFWKLANQYYNGNKAWISDKMLEKLEVTVELNQKKREFLRYLI